MKYKTWEERRKRLFEIVEVGNNLDYASRFYDFLNTFLIIMNLTVSILYTFDFIKARYGLLLTSLERITVVTFLIDYIFRILTAKYLYPKLTEPKAILKYALSFTGLVDLLSFIPYYLPFFFPSGAIAFRMFRIVRIFRLFRITAYYDSLNIITDVIVSKRQQLFSSVFLVSVLMLASSLCMYSLEHEAQPEVFSNAFSGIWWSVSTILTVGYGDIYPITPMGQFFSIIIAFLGVGMVAIPTGIISAGFVEQYSRIKTLTNYGNEKDIHFIRIRLSLQDPWVGQTIAGIRLPQRIIVAAIKRNSELLIPRGDSVLEADDVLILGAESLEDQDSVQLKEIMLQEHNPWVGQRIRDLDISRQSVIILVKHHDKTLIPNGNTVLYSGDTVILYSKHHISGAESIEI